MDLTSEMVITICQEHWESSFLLNSVTRGDQPNLQEAPNNTTENKAVLLYFLITVRNTISSL